jgi:hypothetical protein
MALPVGCPLVNALGPKFFIGKFDNPPTSDLSILIVSPAAKLSVHNSVVPAQRDLAGSLQL